MAEPPSTSPAEHGLERQLGLRDLVLAQVLCVVGSTWVGVAAGLGRGYALTWVAAMLLFYFPMGAVVIGLNRIMPLEGGLYVWAHRAFGGLGGFLTAWNLWVYGIVITAAIVYAIPTELAYLIGPRAAWLPENHWASLAASPEPDQEARASAFCFCIAAEKPSVSTVIPRALSASCVRSSGKP